MTDKQQSSCKRNPGFSWPLYIFWVCLRFYVGVFSPAMIHPDEFFQSYEVMAQHTLQKTNPKLAPYLFIPWEYQPQSPNRSILFPSLVVGVPYYLLEKLNLVNAKALLYLPRILLFSLSLCYDFFLVRILKKLDQTDGCKMHHNITTGTSTGRLLKSFSTNWTTLVFLSRAFSNTFESFMVLLSIAALVLMNPRTRILGTIIHLKTFTLGSLLTFGFFTRFTFLFFFFPIGFELVRHQDALLLEQYTKKQDKVDPAAFGGPSIFKRLVTCIQILLQGFLAFLIWSSIMIFVDTWYFQDTNGFVISPWNNLLYNLKHENVAQHGIHPRITHTFVNMPMLFGLTFLVTMWRFVHSIWYQKTMSSSTQWLYACVLIPLCLISVSPHQEPRFLLPLTVPLHLLLARKRMSKSLQVLSTTINLLMLFFFGFFHQAGIVPMLLSIQEPSPSFHRPWLGDPCQFNRSVASASFFASSTLVFYKTYMPPRFLLAGLNVTKTFQFEDFGGGGLDLNSFHSKLEEILTQKKENIVVIVPGSIFHSLVDEGKFKWTPLGHCGPHLSTENFPATFTRSQLSLHALQVHLYKVKTNVGS